MNGLDAIKFMESTGKIVRCIDSGTYFKIENGVVWYKVLLKFDWSKSTRFDFQSEYEEYVEPKPVTGWHDAGKSMDFFWIDGTDVDDERYRFEDEYPDDNRFSTKEKAEEINFKQTLFRKLQRFSDENGGNEIDWNDYRSSKYCITYDSETSELRVMSYSYMQYPGMVYFLSREVTEQAINKFETDLYAYFEF